MADRYFCSQPIISNHATLDGPEARHVARVMRASIGDTLVLFDGTGSEFVAEIDSLGRDTVELSIVSRETPNRELPFELSLAVALPKGDRQKWLVEKGTELGVTRLVPVKTERSVVVPSSKTVDRLSRTVIEASKQCGRTRLMEIGTPVTWNEISSQVDPAATRLVAHPGGKRLGEIFPEGIESGRSIWVGIGPEGGFSDGEVDAACDKGWQKVNLGARILRIETAALAVAARLTEFS